MKIAGLILLAVLLYLASNIFSFDVEDDGDINFGNGVEFDMDDGFEVDDD